MEKLKKYSFCEGIAILKRRNSKHIMRKKGDEYCSHCGEQLDWRHL